MPTPNQFSGSHFFKRPGALRPSLQPSGKPSRWLKPIVGLASHAIVATGLMLLATLQTATSQTNSRDLTGECRLTKISTPVFSQTSTLSEAIGILNPDQTVRLRGKTNEGLIAITEPFRGYIQTGSLKRCNSSQEPPNAPDVPTANPLVGQCRAAKRSMPIHEATNADSPDTYTLVANEQVTLAGNGSNGWIRVSQPVVGYVEVAALKPCSSDTFTIP